MVRPRAEMQSPVAAFLFVLLCVNSVCISSALFPVTEDSIVVESDGILDSDAEILTEDDGCTPPPHFPNLRQSYSRTLQHASDSAQGHFSDGLVHFYGFNRIEVATRSSLPGVMNAFTFLFSCQGSARLRSSPRLRPKMCYVHVGPGRRHAPTNVILPVLRWQ